MTQIAPQPFGVPGFKPFLQDVRLPTVPPPPLSTGPTKATWRAVLRVGLQSAPTADPQTLSDLTRYIRDDGGLRMSRGRQEDTQRFDSGTFTCALSNPLGRFDPAIDPNVKAEKFVQYLLEYPWFRESGQPGIVPDGGFDNPALPNWHISNGGAGVDASVNDVFYDSRGQAVIFLALSSAGGGLICDAFPVTAGKSYAGSVRTVQALSSFTTARRATVTVRFWANSNGTGANLLTGIYNSDPISAYSTTFHNDSGWVRIGIGPIIAPLGAQSATIALEYDSSVSGELYYWDSCIFDEAAFQGIVPQWSGYADDWARDQNVGDSICTLNATDGFKVLGYPTLNSKLYSDFIRSTLPTHYFRLSEHGTNNIPTKFVDSITGNNEAHSTIDAGVGPLYNVPGAAITETDGAFSTLGPSSSDKGHIELPKGMAITGNQSWIIAFWYRYPQSGTLLTTTQYLYTQGTIVDTDYINIGVDDTSVQLTMWDGNGTHGMASANMFLVPPTAGKISGNPYGLHNDGAPHLIAFWHDQASNDTYGYFDGVLMAHDLGLASGNVFTARTPMVGAVVNPGVITLPAIAELDEFTVWLAAAAPTDPAIVGSWMANAYKLARLLYPAESSGSRISRLADLCGWPNGLRNIEAGSSNVDVVGAPFTRANPLQEMQNVEASEQGFLFMGKDNKLTFLARHSLFDQDARVELATFGNGVGEVPYSDAAVQNDSRLIINRTEFAMQNGGQVAVYQDDASIASYWPRTDSHSDLQLVTQEEVISAGIWEVVLYKDQTVRISQLTLNPLASEQLLYLCMTAEIGQRLRIRDRKPGVGPVDYVVVLLGMQQTIKRGSLEVTWDVSTVYGQNFMCFGDNFDSLPMGW